MPAFFVALATFVLLSSPAFSAEAHRHHEAHVHGSAELSIAFEKQEGRIEFKAAAEGVLGFEHAPKSNKDIKALQAAQKQFEELDSYVKFDPTLNCQIKAQKIERVAEAPEEGKSKKAHGEHSDFIANYVVSCAKSPQGTHLSLDFTSFPHLQDIDVTILIGDLQKTAELKKKAVTVELK